MMSLLLFGLFATALAAPQYYGHHGPHHGPHGPPPFFPDRSELGFSRQYFNNDNFFDTGRFWADLSRELKGIDDMLADLSSHFPTSEASEGVEGNEYKITIPLSGFEEKDIVVKAKDGLLMVQAIHTYAEGGRGSYLSARNLPSNVNVTGNWVFENGLLKITFPLKNNGEAEVTTEIPTFQTQRPVFESREEMESHGEDDVHDADVGLNRGDQETRDRELLTNEIPDRTYQGVEATTYAVDLKDEVEFVPVRY